jgi:hypothetical protein
LSFIYNHGVEGAFREQIDSLFQQSWRITAEKRRLVAGRRLRLSAIFAFSGVSLVK